MPTLYGMRRERCKGKTELYRTEGQCSPCIPSSTPWVEAAMAQSLLLPESRTRSQFHKVPLMIHCRGAMGSSFKQVTLAGYLHGNSSHPKLFLPVWEETFQKRGKAKLNSGFSFLWPFFFGKSYPFPERCSLLRKPCTEEKVQRL